MGHTSIESCGICGKTHECVWWTSSDPVDFKAGCTGVVCDSMPNYGCFEHFCAECIEKHKCESMIEYNNRRKK